MGTLSKFDFSLQMPKNKAQSIGTYAGKKKNMIFGENRPEIIEFCTKSIKNKKVDFRGFFTKVFIYRVISYSVEL
jgi:hypothetical protein